MIKDMLVNLAVDAARDVAGEYAVSVARAFDAHVTGIGFAYDVFVPGTIFGDVPIELASTERAKNEKVARTAIARFEEAVRGSGVSAASHVLSTSLADAPETFGKLARRFDLSVVAQAEPDNAARSMIIEAALFESGRPVLVVPYVQEKGSRSILCWCAGTAAATPPAR